MKKKNTKSNSNNQPLRGFRMTGAITFKGQPYEVWLSKTGEIAFVQNGVWVEDPALQNQLMDYLLKANQAE